MHFDEFMTQFDSVTVCHVKNELNLLSVRSNFYKRVGKFFYFYLKKTSPLVISLSQMYKRLEATFES